MIASVVILHIARNGDISLTTNGIWLVVVIVYMLLGITLGVCR